VIASRIVTTTAAPSTAEYHDRMPVVHDAMTGCVARRAGRGDDETLCREVRGVGGRTRDRQRQEQSAKLMERVAVREASKAPAH